MDKASNPIDCVPIGGSCLCPPGTTQVGSGCFGTPIVVQTPVPTLSEVGVGILIALVLALGLTSARRKLGG
jgi:hypothetical protein